MKENKEPDNQTRYMPLGMCRGNDAAKKLYESFGFVEIDRDEDEIIMELTL